MSLGGKATREVERIEKPDRVMPWGPWGPWVPQPLPFGGPGIPNWVHKLVCHRTRTRVVWKRWKERTVKIRCRKISVQGGDVPDSSSGDVHLIGGIYWRWDRIPVTDWQNFAAPQIETDTDTGFFDPPDELFPAQAVVTPDIMRGSSVWMETDWLRGLPEVRSFRVLFDGERYPTIKGRKPHRIDTRPLSPGLHTFQLDIRLKNGRRRSTQVSFSVIAPIELDFARPVVVADLNDLFRGRRRHPNNGCIAVLTVVNRTNAMRLVSLDATGVPSGWKAVIAGKSVVRVGAGKKARVRIIAELMTDMGLTTDALVPITVTGYTGLTRDGTKKNQQSATCYVQPVLRSSIRRRVVALNARLRRRRISKAYGPWRATP